MNSKGYAIAYTIQIAGVTIESEGSNADLISFMTSCDSSQSDYGADIILGNKDHKYDYEFIKGDNISVDMSIVSIDTDSHSRSIEKTYHIFGGVVTMVNWTYKEAHLVCEGHETVYNNDSPAKRRTYSESDLANRATFVKKVVGDLIDDYNEAHPTSPIDSAFDLNPDGPFPVLNAFETSDGEQFGVIMDRVDEQLGCTHWTEELDGKVYLVFGDPTQQTNFGETIIVPDSAPWAGLVWDSAAVNEVGFVTEVKVHGSQKTDNTSDDRSMPSTKGIWGMAKYNQTSETVTRHIDVVDYTIQGAEECQKRAQNILTSSAIKDAIKPVFTNFYPKIASQIVFTDPLTGIQITGKVYRKELRVSCQEGWVCTVELAQAAAPDTNVGITLSSGED
jgi:hypothetical protein